MTGKRFVDANILIYAHDLDAGVKRGIAASKLTELWHSGLGCLSTQVLQEFFVNATRKIKSPLARSVAREVVRTYAAWVYVPISPATILRATEISEVWPRSFWDSMNVASAEESNADSLLTEDLNDGQIIAGIKVINPFREQATLR
jgi:predicted nucleic acid-binding protein